MLTENEPNFATFRDCISVAVIERSEVLPVRIVRKNRSSKRHSRSATASSKEAPKGSSHHAHVYGLEASSPAELADFVAYLAEEAFPTLPASLRDLTYQMLQDDNSLAEAYANPLSSNLVETVANALPPSIEDSLLAYLLIRPPATDLCSFLAPVLNSYVSAAATTPPPHPRASACEICERDWITLTAHHLIPRGVHAKVLKRGWHPAAALNSVAWLCRACHSFVHGVAGNEELARWYFKVELLRGREDVRRFAAWVGGVRWKKR